MDAYEGLPSCPVTPPSQDPRSHNYTTNMSTPGLDYLQR
jgi:hypothetical protein